MQSADEEISIETATGPAKIWTRGTGPRLIVFHGGPGFDHRPLLTGLKRLERYRTLVFFDQLGSGTASTSEQPVTAEALFAHATSIVEALGPDPLGFVAHSWGCVMAAAVATRRPGLSYREALLINPIALDDAGYAAARAAIAAKVPPETLERVWAMLGAGATGAAAFSLLLPFYVEVPPSHLPEIDVAAQVFIAADATLGHFDFWPALDRFGPYTIIRGGSEFVPPGTIAPFLKGAEHDIVMDGVGHFPYLEDPAGFASALDRLYAAA